MVDLSHCTHPPNLLTDDPTDRKMSRAAANL